MEGTDQSESSWHVSTGHLPSPAIVTTLVAEPTTGLSPIQKAKTRLPIRRWSECRRDLFGVCVVDADGNVHVVGDAEYEFTIMSVSKPFVFALVCQELGVEEISGKNWCERHRIPLQLAGRH